MVVFIMFLILKYLVVTEIESIEHSNDEVTYVPEPLSKCIVSNLFGR
jgi:hypothetical protein